MNQGPIHLPIMDRPSVKCVLYKTLFVFLQNSMKLGEVVVRPLEAGESGLRIMHDICELSIIMDIEFLFSKYHGINT